MLLRDENIERELVTLEQWKSQATLNWKETHTHFITKLASVMDRHWPKKIQTLRRGSQTPAFWRLLSSHQPQPDWPLVRNDKNWNLVTSIGLLRCSTPKSWIIHPEYVNIFCSSAPVSHTGAGRGRMQSTGLRQPSSVPVWFQKFHQAFPNHSQPYLCGC